IYVGSYDGNVNAYDAATGTLLWTGPTGNGNYIAASPTVGDGLVYVGSGSGRVFAFPETCSTPCAPVWSRLLPSREVAGMAEFDHRLFVPSEAGALFSLNADTGAVLWKATVPNQLEAGVILAHAELCTLGRARRLHAHQSSP